MLIRFLARCSAGLSDFRGRVGSTDVSGRSQVRGLVLRLGISALITDIKNIIDLSNTCAPKKIVNLIHLTFQGMN